MTVKEKFVYIVSLDKTLKCFLELPGVFSSLIDYQKGLLFEKQNSGDTIIRKIIQGKLWEDMTINYGKDEVLVPLFIYFDELETGNPLNSRAGESMLGAVFTPIATVPPSMSSQLENIFLSRLSYSHDRTSFGNGSIFRAFISDLKKLETNGINIDVYNEQLNVKFIVVTMPGDNLGLHGILRFFESFNSTNFRNFDDYELYVENQLGIKESCIWHDLPSYHVHNNWSVDVMHDLMEGIHRYSMALIIDKLRRKYLTLDELNS